MSKSSDRPIDYAAIARSTMKSSGQKPSWLIVGGSICAPSRARGIGEITTILGDRIIVKFPNYSVPVLINNWQEALINQEIFPPDHKNVAEDLSQQEIYDVTNEDIATIPHPEFQAIATSFQPALAAIRVLGETEGISHPLPTDLPEILQATLRGQGYTHLWSHQLESLEALRNGNDVLLATPTASGKTLAFLPAILETCLQNPQATALLIFPLKALALDQMTKLEAIAKPIGLHVGIMNGDVSKTERLKLFTPTAPQILCLTPELLHYQFLQKWETWKKFLAQLRYVVIDEAHTYRGSFGGHFANLMRRLRLAIDRQGGNSDRLQYILATATIGNPIELAERITERKDRLVHIDRNGARTSGRTILCMQPTASTNTEACHLIIEWLDRHLSGIVFCNSRAAIKSLLALTNAELKEQHKEHYQSALAVFYGSLNTDRRHQIIEEVRQNKVRVIFATSALEAGIDLPELDCCLIKGYPGSLMSFYQRIGRAGRQSHGLVIFLPYAGDPLDYFYGINPFRLLDGEVERALGNPDYHSILTKHLCCAARESRIPVAEIDRRFGGKAGTIVDELLKQKALQLNPNFDLHTDDYPHNSVSFRGSTQDTVDLIDSKTNQKLEELSLFHAYREVFPEAIYSLQGSDKALQYYRSQSLDLESQAKRAVLVPLLNEPGLYTQATQDMDKELLEKLREPRLISLKLQDCKLRLSLHWAKIINRVIGYSSISKERAIACPHPHCALYHKPTSTAKCGKCQRVTKRLEITKVIDNNLFEPPYEIRYEAPILKVEMNLALAQPLQEYATQLKEQIKAKFGEQIPAELSFLFQTDPAYLALHSLCHQISIAVPLLVLSDRQDINSLCEIEDRTNTLKPIAYFFDTTDGGNGTCEELFDRFESFASRATHLVEGCTCQYGCPRCLIDYHCPQNNEQLNKALGLFLLKTVAF
jgi:DEAD/DEAH box helicase domain-containing protein